MTMIERVAEGIGEYRSSPDDGPLKLLLSLGERRAIARAALEAMREPTGAMIEDGCDTLNNEVSWRGKEAECAFPCHLVPVYQAMINKAIEGE